MRRSSAAAATAAALLPLSPAAAPAATAPPKAPTADGTRGAAATVDPVATRAAINVLRRGGNAIDAAVTAAGVLGMVEPYSCGIGGGGLTPRSTPRVPGIRLHDSAAAGPPGKAGPLLIHPPPGPA